MEKVAESETLERKIFNSEMLCSAVVETISASLDLERMWFFQNEDIIISYEVSNQEEITDFDYAADGLSIVDIEVAESNLSRITAELDISSNEVDSTLELRINVGSGEINETLYLMKNQYGTFVSQFSTDNAYV